MGEASIKHGKFYEAEPEHYEFGKRFWALTDKLLNEGQLHIHEVEVQSEGLGGVVSGLERLRDGKAKGHKLVYLVE